MTMHLVGITADIVVYDPAFGKVLVVKRKNHPYKGQWALPGGFVDEGETFLQAAVRELQEETGLIAAPQDMTFVGVYDEPNRDPRGRTISVAFFTVYDGRQEPVAADDAVDVSWSSTAMQFAFDHNKIVYDALRVPERNLT